MLLCFMSATIAGSQYSKTENQGTGIAVIVFFWLHGVCYAFAWSGLLIAYTVEVLPFKLRAKGLMIMNIAVNVALVMNNQVNPIPMDGVWKGTEWKLYCVYTAWIAVELCFVYFFYVETKYVLCPPSGSKQIYPMLIFYFCSTGAPRSRKSPASSTATRPRSAPRTSRTTRSCPTTTTTRSCRTTASPSSARPSRTRFKCGDLVRFWLLLLRGNGSGRLWLLAGSSCKER